MNAVLDSAPTTAHTESASPERATASRQRCPECLAPVVGRQPGKLFCSPEHKRAYNNRWMTRGAVLAPLYAAARSTRGGSRGDKSTGTRARADAEHLVQRWTDEDTAAKRMPAVEYMAIRYRLGLVDVA